MHMRPSSSTAGRAYLSCRFSRSTSTRIAFRWTFDVFRVSWWERRSSGQLLAPPALEMSVHDPLPTGSKPKTPALERENRAGCG